MNNRENWNAGSGSLDRHVRHILENARDYSEIADVLRQDCHGHTDRLPTEVHEAAVKLDDAFKAMTEVLRELLETSAVVSLSEAKDQIEITLPAWNHDAAWEALDIVLPNASDQKRPEITA
jgi:ribosomal protein L7/L12